MGAPDMTTFVDPESDVFAPKFQFISKRKDNNAKTIVIM